MERKAMHLNEALQILDIARERRQEIILKVWEGSTGNILTYRNWMVSSSSWRGGWHRIINPLNNEIRTVPDIFIISLNGHPIYL